MTLLVTDDEVMAAVGIRGTVWPGVLPTVDLSNPDLVAAATFRGGRSLNVRGLLRAEQSTLAEEAGLLLRLLDGEPVTSGFVAPTDTPLAATGSGFVVVRDEAGFVLDLTLADGTHDLSAFEGPEEPLAVVQQLTESIYVAGVAGQRALTLLVGASASQAPAVFEVGKGHAQRGALTPEGDAVSVRTMGDELDADALSAAISAAWGDLVTGS